MVFEKKQVNPFSKNKKTKRAIISPLFENSFLKKIKTSLTKKKAILKNSILNLKPLPLLIFFKLNITLIFIFNEYLKSFSQ